MGSSWEDHAELMGSSWGAREEIVWRSWELVRRSWEGALTLSLGSRDGRAETTARCSGVCRRKAVEGQWETTRDRGSSHEIVGAHGSSWGEMPRLAEEGLRAEGARTRLLDCTQRTRELALRCERGREERGEGGEG